MKIITCLIIWLVAIPAFSQEICISDEEKKLYDLIMQYRKSKKLKSIPLSAKLTKTAQVHVHDLHATMLHLLGMDHRKLTFRVQGRDFRLTDVAGRVVGKLLRG